MPDGVSTLRKVARAGAVQLTDCRVGVGHVRLPERVCVWGGGVAGGEGVEVRKPWLLSDLQLCFLIWPRKSKFTPIRAWCGHACRVCTGFPPDFLAQRIMHRILTYCTRNPSTLYKYAYYGERVAY